MTEILLVFSAWQFLSTPKDGFSQRFVTSEGAFSFAKVTILALSNVKIKMHLALRYSVVVGLRMQISAFTFVQVDRSYRY